MSTFTIKENDTSPSWSATLTEAAGNLSGSSVKLIMRKLGASSAKVDASATIVDADAGIVRYDWQAGDTDTPGVYRAEWEVTYSDSSVESFPNGTFFLVSIEADLG